jgi:uncharacterized protein (DUF2147 family)
MRSWVLALAALLLATAAAPAAPPSPVGEWLVANGSAHIRIVDCGGQLWGVVSWEKKPGRDRQNPDPAKRNRPTLGMPVLLHMTPGDERGRWEGEVYNADDGNSYDASIALRNADVLHVEGCALGILCGGEDWTRLAGGTAGAPGLGAGLSPARLSPDALCAAIGAGGRRGAAIGVGGRRRAAIGTGAGRAH